MASSSTIPLLRFRYLLIRTIPFGILFSILSACSSVLISVIFMNGGFCLLHYDGRTGGSRTPRYGFPLLTSLGIGAGDRFDPQFDGLG